MKLGFSIAYMLSVFLLIPSHCQAEQMLLPPDRLSSDAQGKIDFFKSRPAKDFMSREEFRLYDQALSEQNCLMAGRVLTKAFFRTYSQFRPAKTRYECKPEDFVDCAHWEFYVMATFEGYAFCTLNEDFANLEKKLRQSGKSIPKFAMPRFPKKKHYDNSDIRGRDEVLASLIAKADGGYIPALEKVADLIRQGDVFSARNDVEYYVLRRACVLSEECAKWQTRLDTLKNEIGLKRAEHIDAVAIMPKLKQPRLNDIVLGKPI